MYHRRLVDYERQPQAGNASEFLLGIVLVCNGLP